jgi:hypothetical protein
MKEGGGVILISIECANRKLICVNKGFEAAFEDSNEF